ncbi:hypothetical protein C0J52_15009 [Blattella germanica]|nr:hypothetical protein C0J52_15009 [Blattella germanica]
MCFLPFMLCGTNVVNLYCAQCNRFLGTYDRKRNVLVEKDMNQACSASTVQSHRSEPTICACKTDCQE